MSQFIGQGGMVTLAIDNAPRELHRRHPIVDCLIEDGFGTGKFKPLDERITPTRVNRALDGTPATASLRTSLDATDLSYATVEDPLGQRHFSHLLDDLTPDLRILIVQLNGEGEPKYLFDGFPQQRTLAWSQSSQSMQITLIDTASEQLKTLRAHFNVGRMMRDSGRYEWTAGDEDRYLFRIRALPLHFNADGKPNRTPDAYPVLDADGDEIELHFFTEDGAPEAEHWTYAQAIRYIVYTLIDKAGGFALNTDAFWEDTAELVDATYSESDLNSFRRRMTQRIRDLRIDACSADEILAQLIHEAGLHYEYQLTAKRSSDGGGEESWEPEHRLRIFATPIEDEDPDYTMEMGRPRSVTIPREAPFTATDDSTRTIQDMARANAAQQASLTYDHRGSGRVLYIGGKKRYECTLLLLPGWLPFDPPYTDSYPDLIAADLTADYVLDNVAQTEDDIRDAREYWWSRLAEGNERGLLNGEEIITTSHHRASRYHPSVADVGRRWVFPTDWRYGSADRADPDASEYMREGLGTLDYEPFLTNGDNRLSSPTIGGGIGDAALERWIARRRPFDAPIARLMTGGTQQPRVEFKVGGTPFETTGWQDFPHHVRIDEREAAIYIEVDNLYTGVQWESAPARYDDNWYTWIIEQKLWLRITCTVEGDDRLLVDARPFTPWQRRRTRMVDAGNRFRYQKRRGNNSIFNADPTDDDPEFEDLLDLADGEGRMKPQQRRTTPTTGEINLV